MKNTVNYSIENVVKEIRLGVLYLFSTKTKEKLRLEKKGQTYKHLIPGLSNVQGRPIECSSLRPQGNQTR